MKVAHHSMLPILSSVFSGGHVTIEGFTELAGPIPEEKNSDPEHHFQGLQRIKLRES